ncbi:hypothetical protein NDI45_25035 [Leptolyngbya sp. GB1-A1]|uniref:hypothetical protein n=1 Tax=Leptolyngbya sp. GB1-A1 TaxID=2933908 RepID=UPI0032987CF0
MTALSPRASETFQYVEEHDNQYLSLFPHRGDYLYAEHPDPDESPQWKTESRHFLSDRLIQQGAYLYGVRFGKTTNYVLLDIDTGSLYHPSRDRLAISRMAEALEPVGLVSHVSVSSSYRGGNNPGLHLYFPFTQSQSTWTIALVAQTLLENAGFKLKPGQLELFPNPKPYGEDGPTLYNGHRLPLQAGSYLLNADFQPIHTSRARFVQQWKFAEGRNDLDSRRLKQVLKQAKRRRYIVSGKAQKFLNDLNAEIEPGWTGAGQTNRILGKIACRARVFYHVHHGGSPLEGEALAQVIAEIAQSLPGYEEYCNHKAEIEERSRLYGRSSEKRYYPYGYRQRELDVEETKQNSTEQGNVLNWNQQQSQAAQERIRKAVAELQEQGNLPSQKTARRNALRAYRISNKTLDKYPELWWESSESLQGEEYYPVDADLSDAEGLKSLQGEEYYPMENNKLVGLSVCDAPQQQAQDSPTSGEFPDLREVSTVPKLIVPAFSNSSQTVASAVQQVIQFSLFQENRLAAKREKQMRQWLQSGDPILMAEANQYFQLSLVPID